VGARRPCHNDLLAANFLGAGDRLVILDWEYAGMNDRYFDLGNLATNNELDEDAEIALVERYFGAVTPRRRARLALMKIMSDFREAMWAVVQQGISSLDVDYVDYARRNFDRLLANAAAPGYGRLLADAAEPD
jgi:thiamine kinase-like enzyme